MRYVKVRPRDKVKITTAKTSFLYKFVVVDIFAMKRSSFQETLLNKSILQTKTGGDSRKTIIINPNALLCFVCTTVRFNHHSSTNTELPIKLKQQLTSKKIKIS